MAAIVKAGGSLVTIGSFAGGFPLSSTNGTAIVSRDAGIPLNLYEPGVMEIDPLVMWRTQPSLRKVVSFAARQVGSMPWHAYRRINDNDRMRIHHSKAEQMLRWPSRWVTGYKLWSDLATDRMLYDLFCVMFIKGINGQQDRLVRIPPRMLEIKLDFLGQLVQVILRTPAGEDDVDITDAPIALSYGWHPNGNAGVSPLYTLSQLLLETRQAVEWRTSQWSNTPKISGILKRPETAPKWDATKRERFLQSWRTWRDTPKAGGTPLLEDGMTYETLEGVAPSDAKDIEGRMLTDVEVASAFHIPPELVGAREGNFSNIGAFRQMLFGPTLGPMFEDMQQAVNIGLIPHLETTDDTYVEINREAAINGSFLEQASLLQTLVGGPVMTRAEGRAKLNLPHLDGTDELIVPLNVTAGGQASPTDSGSQNVDLTNPK